MDQDLLAGRGNPTKNNLYFSKVSLFLGFHSQKPSTVGGPLFCVPLILQCAPYSVRFSGSEITKKGPPEFGDCDKGFGEKSHEI